MNLYFKKATVSFVLIISALVTSALAQATTCSGLSVQVNVQNDGADTLISLLNASAKLPLTASLVKKDTDTSLILVKLDAGYAEAMHASALDAAKVISTLSEDADLKVNSISVEMNCSAKKPAL